MSESPSAAPRLLSPAQRRLAGFALGLFALLASGALLIFSFIVLARVVGFFSSVLWPLAAAGVMALMLQPAVEFVERRLKLEKRGAVVLLFGLFALALASLAVVVMPPLLGQLLEFIGYAPSLATKAKEYIQQHYPEWMAVVEHHLQNPTVKQIADSLMAEVRAGLTQALPTLRSAGDGLLAMFSFITCLATIPIYLFFFLLSGREPTEGLDKHLTFLKEDLRTDLIFLVREFIAIVVSFFRGQLLIGLLMGVLLAIGFSLIGLRFGLFIGVVLGVLNIVPYLGTIIGMAIALPLAFLQPDGGFGLVGLVTLVFIVVQNIEGWYLTPKIMGDRTGLHPVTIIVAIFFWGTALDGILGMVLAIPLTAFFVTAWRLARRKYLKPAA